MLTRKNLAQLTATTLTSLTQAAAAALGTKITDLIIWWITRH